MEKLTEMLETRQSLKREITELNGNLHSLENDVAERLIDQRMVEFLKVDWSRLETMTRKAKQYYEDRQAISIAYLTTAYQMWYNGFRK